MKYVIEDIVEIIEDFINDNEFSKGLRQSEVVRLKAAVDLLQTYESTLPDDILGAIRDIVQFTANLSDRKKKKDEDESDEKSNLKKEVVHDWGFSLAPNDNDFEKEETKKRRKRRKSGTHNWGFSFADLDTEKEDEDIKKDEDEDE